VLGRSTGECHAKLKGAKVFIASGNS